MERPVWGKAGISAYIQRVGEAVTEHSELGFYLLAVAPDVEELRWPIDTFATTDELEQLATLIPEEWLAPSANGSRTSASTRSPTSSAPGPTGSSFMGQVPRNWSRS